MNKELLYEIAKIVDNDFIGSFETFSCNLIKSEYYYLSTNKCDWSSLIRVYVENNKIIRITRICDDTDGYKDIQSATMEKIIKLVAPKQILKSFALEGKITQVHAQEIETTLTEALRERDEMLEKAKSIIEGVIEDRNEKGLGASQDIKWLTRYNLLDKEIVL